MGETLALEGLREAAAKRPDKSVFTLGVTQTDDSNGAGGNSRSGSAHIYNM